MSKLRAYLLFALLALPMAGLFGMVHDQISYTVAPEYFTHFKFLQFGLLDEAVPERVRAAQVGFLASWWMGIPLGLLAGLAGFLQPTAAQMRRALRWSLLLLPLFTLTVALLGLLYGVVQTADLQALRPYGHPHWFVPADLAQPRRFLCAGHMHNAAYLGGALSIPAAWVFHLLYRWRHRTATRG